MEQNQKQYLQKQKILKKYLDQTKIKKSKDKDFKSSNFYIQDQDDKQQSSIQIQDSSEEELTHKRVRIQSDDEGQNNNHAIRTKIKKVNKQDKSVMKSKKLKKKLKKALGIQNDQQIDEFMKQIKIQGMELSDLKKMLKDNSIKLNLQNQPKKDKKKKKQKKIKKQEKQKEIKKQDKFKAYHKSSSSDIEIPEQARTIYRNKDGTIKINTDKDLRQKKEEQTMNRLAEWEKGMKKQDSDQHDHQDIQMAKKQIWDDPLKIWNQQNLIKPLTCKYMSPTNRFNIKPGFRWDGVIRGNGFQTKYLQQQSLKKAKASQQHKEYLKNL